jgi:DNA-binding CsgD family transcriptional regulator
LGISKYTLNEHIANIYRKLAVNSRAACASRL